MIMTLARLLSCFLNLIINRGSIDETYCASVYLKSLHDKKYKKKRRILNKIFFWEDDHCLNSWVNGLNKDKK